MNLSIFYNYIQSSRDFEKTYNLFSYDKKIELQEQLKNMYHNLDTISKKDVFYLIKISKKLNFCKPIDLFFSVLEKADNEFFRDELFFQFIISECYTSNIMNYNKLAKSKKLSKLINECNFIKEFMYIESITHFVDYDVMEINENLLKLTTRDQIMNLLRANKQIPNIEINDMETLNHIYNCVFINKTYRYRILKSDVRDFIHIFALNKKTLSRYMKSRDFKYLVKGIYEQYITNDKESIFFSSVIEHTLENISKEDVIKKIEKLYQLTKILK